MRLLNEVDTAPLRLDSLIENCQVPSIMKEKGRCAVGLTCQQSESQRFNAGNVHEVLYLDT